MKLAEPGLENQIKQKMLKYIGKRTRRTAIFRIFVIKRSFHGTPGQVYQSVYGFWLQETVWLRAKQRPSD
jgi:hypothetical protein